MQECPERQWWQTPTFAALTLTIAILSLAWGLYTHFASREEKRPMYAVEGTSLVSPTQRDEHIRILYNNVEVPRVSSTTVYFWNAGRKTIEGSDASGSDPLRIVVPRGVKVLLVRNAKTSGKNATMSVTQGVAGILLAFEYLDKSDGSAIQVLHTGSSDLEWKIEGKIKGSPAISEISLSNTHKVSRTKLATALFSPVVAAFLLQMIALGYSRPSLPPRRKRLAVTALASAVMLAIVSVAYAIALRVIAVPSLPAWVR